jgi:UDP-N-acetylglucosamine 2-epimerase (non-hydrolysing)
VLVLRDETERPEAVAAGTVQLVGPHRAAIVEGVRDLWEKSEVYARFALAVNPYGDGRAADRIARALREQLGIDLGEPERPIPAWPPVGTSEVGPVR